jgi:hypothetical protein
MGTELIGELARTSLKSPHRGLFLPNLRGKLRPTGRRWIARMPVASMISVFDVGERSFC